jgi:hypothetical protein
VSSWSLVRVEARRQNIAVQALELEHDCRRLTLPHGVLPADVQVACWKCPACDSWWEYTNKRGSDEGWSWKRLCKPSRRWRRQRRKELDAAAREAAKA